MKSFSIFKNIFVVADLVKGVGGGVVVVVGGGGGGEGGVGSTTRLIFMRKIPQLLPLQSRVSFVIDSVTWLLQSKVQPLLTIIGCII